MMAGMRIRLIHWNETEAEEKAAVLSAAGFAVAYKPLTGAYLRNIRDDPPDAIIIDLSRIPSRGRDLGLAIRHYKTTRRVPLVFVDGAPGTIEGIRKILPDAVYTSWKAILDSLQDAIANPPADPVVPESVMAGYSGTPLPKKLGIKENSVVFLVGAPEDFERRLGELPDGVVLKRRAIGSSTLTLWFTRSRKDLDRRIDKMVPRAENGGLWIIWPKQVSRVTSDLTQNTVRKAGLAAGMVDFKVCAVDETWSGFRFTLRKK
jgi:hypothetical protein